MNKNLVTEISNKNSKNKLLLNGTISLVIYTFLFIRIINIAVNFSAIGQKLYLIFDFFIQCINNDHSVCLD